MQSCRGEERATLGASKGLGQEGWGGGHSPYPLSVMGADHRTHSVMAEWASLWFICIPEALTLPEGDTPKTGRFSSTINNKCVVLKQ